MQVIGHRGAAALAPENTMEGFDVALALSVDGIETDIRETSDRELILMHDKRLDRTTSGAGLVKSVSWPVIKTLDAGSWFSEAYRGAKVPRLGDVLEHYGRQTHWVLEIKEPGTELRILEMVEERAVIESVTFTSFYFTALQNLKQKRPGARTGFLASTVDGTVLRRVVKAGLNQFCPPAQLISPQLVSSCKALGLEVRVWGIADIAAMMATIRAGVDGATVDSPQLLLKTLGR